MSERRQIEFPIDTRYLLGVLVVIGGVLSIRAVQSFQEVLETKTANELNGTGYRVTRSDLGPNLLLID